MRHTISIIVENEFGVLARVVGLFSGRGFNIDSLSVSETLEPSVSRMTIVSTGDDEIVEQILKQLNKLVNVIKVTDYKDTEFIDREMVIVKVQANDSTKAELMRLKEIFRCKIVDVSPKTYTLELTGDEGKLKAALELLRPLGIKEMVRTGRVALQRGTMASGD